jgi:hypothetical protein
MQIHLSHEDISILLNALNPFSHPENWDSEDLNKLEQRIKTQLLPQQLKVCSPKLVFYPGEWTYSIIAQYALSGNYNLIFINCDSYQQQHEIQLNLNRLFTNHIIKKFTFKLVLNNKCICYIKNCEDEISYRGINFDIIFL